MPEAQKSPGLEAKVQMARTDTTRASEGNSNSNQTFEVISKNCLSNFKHGQLTNPHLGKETQGEWKGNPNVPQIHTNLASLCSAMK